MGPSLEMLSLTSVKVTLWPGKGHAQGGLLSLAVSSFLGTFEVKAVWMLAENKSVWLLVFTELMGKSSPVAAHC
jgi:hypothetical protein